MYGDFLMRVDETYIDYSIIFLSRILIKINLKKDQRQRTVAQCGLIQACWTVWQP